MCNVYDVYHMTTRSHTMAYKEIINFKSSSRKKGLLLYIKRTLVISKWEYFLTRLEHNNLLSETSLGQTTAILKCADSSNLLSTCSIAETIRMVSTFNSSSEKGVPNRFSKKRHARWHTGKTPGYSLWTSCLSGFSQIIRLRWRSITAGKRGETSCQRFSPIEWQTKCVFYNIKENIGNFQWLERNITFKNFHILLIWRDQMS